MAVFSQCDRPLVAHRFHAPRSEGMVFLFGACRVGTGISATTSSARLDLDSALERGDGMLPMSRPAGEFDGGRRGWDRPADVFLLGGAAVAWNEAYSSTRQFFELRNRRDFATRPFRIRCRCGRRKRNLAAGKGRGVMREPNSASVVHPPIHQLCTARRFGLEHSFPSGMNGLGLTQLFRTMPSDPILQAES